VLKALEERIESQEKMAANVGYSLIPSEQEHVPIRCTISNRGRSRRGRGRERREGD